MHKSFVALALLAAVPVFAQGTAPAAPQGVGQSLLVLDASGSMWGKIQGRPKVEIAREAVATMLDDWPRGQQLGLMAYGHRSKGDCADIELLKAPAPLQRDGFLQAVNALQPKGMTPISAAVRLAAEELKFSERKATVILVSDGEETCHADPCALGKELERLGVDFTAHVIGFDLKQGSAAQQQLQCLASSTGGRYLDARDAASLNAALKTVTHAPPKSDQPSLTLYNNVDLQGTPVRIEKNVANLQEVPATEGFDGSANDYTYSLEAVGRWEVCMDADYTTDCRAVEGKVMDMAEHGGSISSVRYLGASGKGAR